MTERTRGTAAPVAARLLAAASMVITALGPLLGAVLILLDRAAPGPGPVGLHMAADLGTDLLLLAGVSVVTAAVGLVLAVVAYLLARGERRVRRALVVSAVVLLVALPVVARFALH